MATPCLGRQFEFGMMYLHELTATQAKSAASWHFGGYVEFSHWPVKAIRAEVPDSATTRATIGHDEYEMEGFKREATKRALSHACVALSVRKRTKEPAAIFEVKPSSIWAVS
jgi:hypothetical protein